MPFPISIAQLNFVVGDIQGNARKIIDAAREAHAGASRLLLTPELALSAYAAEDLYLRPAFLSACELGLAEIAAATGVGQETVKSRLRYATARLRSALRPLRDT